MFVTKIKGCFKASSADNLPSEDFLSNFKQKSFAKVVKLASGGNSTCPFIINSIKFPLLKLKKY